MKYQDTEDSQSKIQALTWIREASVDSCRQSQRLQLAFVLASVYTGIAVFSIDDQIFLTDERVLLPVLSVPVNLKDFAISAPLILTAFHFVFLFHTFHCSQTVQAMKKISKSIQLPPVGRQALSHSFVITQILMGERLGAVTRAMLWLIAFSTIVLIPTVLSVSFLIKLLPFQDSEVTNIHRVCFLTTMIAGCAFWIAIFPSSRNSKWRTLLSWSVGTAVFAVATGFAWIAVVLPGEEAGWWDWRTTVQRTVNARNRIDVIGRTLVAEGEAVISRDGIREYEPTQHSQAIVGINLSEKRLAKMNARGAFMPKARFERADVRRATFSRARLDSTNWSRAKLDDVDFVGSSLRNARFVGARLYEADFRWADIRGAILGHADGRLADFGGSNLTGAYFDVPESRHARENSFRNISTGWRGYREIDGGTSGSGQLFGGARFSGAVLIASTFRSGFIGGVLLGGADFSAADLRAADLSGVDLRVTDFGSADLRGADLRGADLRGAYLVNAHLGGADLVGAKLHLADLRGANFELMSHSDWDDLRERSSHGISSQFLLERMSSNFDKAIVRKSTLFGKIAEDAVIRSDGNLPGISDRPPSSSEFLLQLSEFIKAQVCGDATVGVGFLSVEREVTKNRYGWEGQSFYLNPNIRLLLEGYTEWPEYDESLRLAEMIKKGVENSDCPAVGPKP